MKKTLLVLGLAILATVSVSSAKAVTAATNAAPPLRPNIVFVLVDDQRFDDLSCTGHPFVKTPYIDRIAREGVKFMNAFVTTPLCSPSRASFLTGQYAHKHGIFDNVARDKESHELVTWPKLLHDAGYQTAFVGKWHMGTDDSPRPGFDHWVSVKGQGQYLDPEINVDGQRKQIKNDYVTDIFVDYAMDFIKRDYNKPFCVFLSHKAVHPDLVQNPDGSLSDPSANNFVPAERHEKLYASSPVERRPNFGAPRGKPALQRKLENLPPLSARTGTDDETIRKRLRVLASVDEGMDRIFAILEDTKHLDNTLVVFTSDEGYFYGEHGLSVERRLAYEESIRIPLLMRYPKLIKPRSIINEMVLNIDIAPTMLELAGATIPGHIQGRSLVPLLRSTSEPLKPGTRLPWRNSFLIEYFSDTVFPRVRNMGYQAVRTDMWKYIHYVEIDHADEFYNLQWDPYETKNLMSDYAAQRQLMQMQSELVRLVKETN